MKRIILLSLYFIVLQLPVVAQTLLKGVVTSAEDKASLPGVSVLNKSDGSGVATDLDGKYSIKAKKGDIIVFSFIGMKTQELKYDGQPQLNVELKNDSELMNEVVIIGYGERRKGTIAGSVSTVGADKLASKPMASFDQALQGQIAGVQVTTSSGEPSASSSIRIRGINSINAGTEPLYIMDGVAISGGDFASLNPSDIENVSVLKDASSTSIYGSRAANGVIVITTKKGKFGEKGRLNFRAYYGVSELANKDYKMMNSQQLLDLEVKVGIRDDQDPAIKKLSKINTNWADEMFRRGNTQNYELSFLGGSESFSYYASGGYFRQDGIAPRSGIERFTLRTNVESRLNGWAKAGANVSLGYTKVETTESGASTQNPAIAAQITKPYYAVRDEEGNYIEKWDNILNPLPSIAKHPSWAEDVKVIASMFVEVKPWKNVALKSLLGLDGSDSESTRKSLPSFIDNGVSGGSTTMGSSRAYRYTWTNTLTYNTSILGSHNLMAMLGQESIRYTSNGFSARNDMIEDDRLSFIGAGTLPRRASGGAASAYSYMSYFGRAEYNYNYKYYLDISLRTDGSSRFAKGNRWANFWSIGAMWDFKKEYVMDQFSFLTMGQLSGSIGTSGNSDIGFYDYMSTVSTGPIYDGANGMAPDPKPGNSDLTWEKLRSMNIGVKLGFWNRMNLTVDFYDKLTSDMLMSVPTSMITGYSSMMQNVGKMRNRGVEFELQGDVLRCGAFNWNLNANVSYNKNTIVELYDGSSEYIESSTGTIMLEGQPYSSFFMPRFAGVNPANGDGLWYDKDGNVINYFSNENAVLLDKTYIAPLSGGFTSTFSYKGLSLSAFFNWVAKRYVVNNNRYFTENTGVDYIMQYNQSVKMLDMWTREGQITEIPRIDVATQFDDHLIEDASYLRLKNVTLSWSLPTHLLQKTKAISGLRAYVQGENLLTFTKYQGFDPEGEHNLTFGRYPTARHFTVGVDITF
ncbi:MAG: SusC/RagA family TonB-linked outer membrane protein [Marinifilaceae bacterium]